MSAIGPTVVTVGVYGFDSGTFLAALRDANVGLLADVRQRRGVRGAEYAWANSKRLQTALADAGIAYTHHPELAPSTEMRRLQYGADEAKGIGKRNRRELAPGFVAAYTAEVLEPADLTPLLAEMPAGAATALLCVERDAEACHRALLAERLRSEHGASVSHLLPPPAA